MAIDADGWILQPMDATQHAAQHDVTGRMRDTSSTDHQAFPPQNLVSIMYINKFSSHV